MTHQDGSSAIRDLIDLAIEHGPDAMAAAFATFMNHAVQIEREQVTNPSLISALPIVKAMPKASSRRR